MPNVTATWNGATADWNTPADWSDGIVPNNTSTDVTLGGLGTYTVTISLGGSFSIDSLLVNNPSATLTDLGSLTLASALTLTAGSFLVENGGQAALGAGSSSTGDFELQGNASVNIGGAFDNSGTLFVDSTSSGGSTTTISGTLTNSGLITVGAGASSETSTSTVTAAGLDNSGTIDIAGGPARATLDITSAAPSTLNGIFSLSGDALLEFASGSIAGIGSGGSLTLDGSAAVVADAGALGTNSALSGLSSDAGVFALQDGASVGITGDFDNSGSVDVDANGAGGSTLTIAGALTNSGSIVIGDGTTGEASPTTVTADTLDNTATIHLFGGPDEATLDITAGAAPTELVAGVDIELYGDALLEFASGSVTTIDAGAELRLSGSAAIVADAGALGTNSALTGLTSNAGIFELDNGAVAGTELNSNSGDLELHAGVSFTTPGDLDNPGTINIDTNDSEGDSSLTVTGTLTNSGFTQLGTSFGDLSTPTTLTTTALDNSGTLAAYGSATAAATVIVSGTASNSGTININPFATFELTAGNTYTQTAGTTTVGGTLSATTSDIQSGTLDLQVGGAVSGSISFAGGIGGTLEIDDTTMPTNTILAFTPGDMFDLTGVNLDPAGHVNLVTNNILRVSENGSTYDLHLDPSQNFVGEYFHLQPDSGIGTEIIENSTPCYCRGTLILTDRGEIPVEELAIGDKVVTISGEARPIKWIGHRSYAGRFIAGNRAVLPIVIEANALDDGVPARDLWVSPEHALYIDEVLVPAGLLINGITIRQVESVERLEYFHIELEAHDVILAEGAPAESFVDCDNRGMFHNGGEFAALYPDDLPERWEFCAPRVEPGSAELNAIRASLLSRAEAPGDRLADDPDLHLIIDGKIVQGQAIEEQVYSFTIPAGSGAIWLASRSAIPAEVEPSSRDRRRLGVPLKRIVLREADLRIEIGYGHVSLREGFHYDESGYRWTDGMARLPEELLRPFAGEVKVELHVIKPGLRYPLEIQAPAAGCERPTEFKRFVDILGQGRPYRSRRHDS